MRAATAGSAPTRGSSWNGSSTWTTRTGGWLIEARRRDYNRLGFALQVVTVRHLGMFLPDPLEVPPELVGYLAEQLGIEDPTCVKRYTDRTRRIAYPAVEGQSRGIRR